MKPTLISVLAFAGVMILFALVFGGQHGTSYRATHPIWPLFAFICAMCAGAGVNTWAENKAERERGE
ncbi:hypothetical protein KYT24_004386 [Salmonella enterica]|nr:hypothetical protein [Salmonella enterica]